MRPTGMWHKNKRITIRTIKENASREPRQPITITDEGMT